MAAAAAGALPRMIGVYVHDGADMLASYHLLTVLAHTTDPTPNRCYLVDLTDDGLLTTTLINDGHLSERIPVGSAGDSISFVRHWEKFLFGSSNWSATTEGAAALEQAKPLQRGASERGASPLRHCYLMYGSSSEMRNILCGIGAASSMINESRRPPHGMRTFFEKLQTRHPTTVFVLALPSDLATTAGQYAARACSHLIIYRSLPVPVPMPLARWPDMRPTGYATTLTVDGEPQLRFALACEMAPWVVMSATRQTFSGPLPAFVAYHRESGSGFYFLWASARNSDVLMPSHMLGAMTRCAASASHASAAAPTRAAFDEALALIRMPPPPPAASKQRASPSKVLPSKASPRSASKRLRNSDSSEATAVPDGGVEEETGVDDEGESSENLDDTAAVSAAGKVIVMLNGKPYSYTPSPLSSEQAERTSLDQMLRDWLLIEAGYESKSYGELAHRLLHILHLKERDVPETLKAAVASFVDGRKGRGYNSKKGDLVTLVNHHINHHKEKALE